MSLFVIKNLYLRRDLFMISFFIFLFMKCTWFARAYRLFYGTMSLNSFIKSCFKAVKFKIVVHRSHLIDTTFNVKHKRHIRKVFIIPIRDNVCFLFFYRILSLPLTSFNENLTTRFLPLQNFESYLVCLLLLDQSGAGEAGGGQGGPCLPPIKFSMMLFFCKL